MSISTNPHARQCSSLVTRDFLIEFASLAGNHRHPLPLGVDGLHSFGSRSGGPVAAAIKAGAKLRGVIEARFREGFAAEVLEGKYRGLSGPADQRKTARAGACDEDWKRGLVGSRVECPFQQVD